MISLFELVFHYIKIQKILRSNVVREEAQKETTGLILTKILCSSPTSPSSCQRFGPLLLNFILLAKRAKTARNANYRDEAEARWNMRRERVEIPGQRSHP